MQEGLGSRQQAAGMGVRCLFPGRKWEGVRSAGPAPGDRCVYRFGEGMTLRVEVDGSLRRVAVLSPYRSASGGRAVLAARSPDRTSIPLAPDVLPVGSDPGRTPAFRWQTGTGPPLLHIPPPEHARPLRLPRDGTRELWIGREGCLANDAVNF